MNLREWSVAVLVLAILSLAALGYALSVRASGGWRTVVNLVGGGLILVLGVTLADRLMSDRGKDGRERIAWVTLAG